MTTYLESPEELIIGDDAVAIPVEVVEELASLILRQVEAVVDEAPTEVVNVQLAVTIVVHRLEDAGDALDATR